MAAFALTAAAASCGPKGGEGPRAAALTALPCTQVDPAFAWFTERSAESLAEELWAKGYRGVRFTVTNRAAVRADLVTECHSLGLKAILVTFGNGVYSTADLPPGWERWKMRTRNPEASAGYTYLCLNNPEYLKWKQQDVRWMIRQGGFDAVEVCEPFWPAHSGPEAELYGCLCDTCLARFRSETGMDAPEFSDSASPRFWKTDTKRYARWVDARAGWLGAFLDSLFNGKDGIRKACPGVETAVWGIASRPAGPRTMREWEGVDGKEIVQRCKPDAYVVQTDWPDWTDAGLPADYVLSYRPYIDAAKSGDGQIPVLIQTDSGSQTPMRRTLAWLDECDRAAKKAGARGVFAYMHSLEMDIYTAPMRILKVRDRGQTVRIVLNKWPSLAIEDAGGWTVSGAKLASVKRDGCSIVVTLDERKPGAPVTLGWKPVEDDPSRRWFKDHGPCVWDGPSEVTIGAAR
jgi:hypothetical protein